VLLRDVIRTVTGDRFDLRTGEQPNMWENSQLPVVYSECTAGRRILMGRIATAVSKGD